MKALKTIITTTILLFLTSTQQTQAQTKEETIAWIKEKLEKSTVFETGSTLTRLGTWSNFTIKNIEPCSIVIEYKYTSSKGEVSDYVQTLPTNNVNIDEVGRLIYTSKVVLDKNISKGKNSFVSKSEFGIVKNEPDLRNRFLKALNHLATFCVEKKEAF